MYVYHVYMLMHMYAKFSAHICIYVYVYTVYIYAHTHVYIVFMGSYCCVTCFSSPKVHHKHYLPHQQIYFYIKGLNSPDQLTSFPPKPWI